MDTLFKWITKVLMFLTGNKPKELPQSLYEGIILEEAPKLIKVDDDIALIGQLVKIKRELNGDVVPDEITQAVITRMLNVTIPEIFRKNFVNGSDELYISYTDVKLTSERLSFGTEEDNFAKALPHVIKKLQSLGVATRISSNMLIISRADLMEVATKNDIVPVDDTDFSVNSTGIYR